MKQSQLLTDLQQVLERDYVVIDAEGDGNNPAAPVELCILEFCRGVLAADAAGPAVQALAAAANTAGRRVTVEPRDLFRRPLRADELKRFDAVVIDPPRAGAAAQMAELAKSKVPRIAAVSCNPNTFARDAALLTAAGYRLERLWPVGQFRWSTHVELAAMFIR